VRTPEVEKLTAVLGAEAVVVPGTDGAVYVSGVDAATIGDAAQRGGIALHQLATESPDLEDVFLQLTMAKAAVR
jgi:ABC-2 type transport system ATP-binding protein